MRSRSPRTAATPSPPSTVADWSASQGAAARVEETTNLGSSRIGTATGSATGSACGQ